MRASAAAPPRRESRGVPGGNSSTSGLRTTVRIVLAGTPSDDPPSRGVFLLPDRQVTFEIAREQPGSPAERIVLRSAWAWVRVQEWRVLASASGASLGTASLVFDLTEYPPAGPDDVAILEHARRLLSNLRSWDRRDDRICNNDAPGSSSLFCILANAVQARMGRYHHRQPALEIVRGIVARDWSERLLDHPIMDLLDSRAPSRFTPP